MVFHGSKSIVPEVNFLTVDIGSLGPHRTTSFSRCQDSKLCESVLYGSRNIFTKFYNLRTTQTSGTVRSKRAHVIRLKFEFQKERFLTMKNHDFDQIFHNIKLAKFSVILTVGGRFSTFFRSDSGKMLDFLCSFTCHSYFHFSFTIGQSYFHEKALYFNSPPPCIHPAIETK